MELREYIAIFRKHRKYFWVTVCAFVIVALVWQHWQGEYVVGNLTLNVTRLGSDKTTDYQYHDFYRLQADERFADTVVRWLESPRMVSDIYESAQVNVDTASDRTLSHALTAERLSSQVIQVTYNAENALVARKISQSLIDKVNTEAGALNKDQQEVSWFVVVGSDPVIRDGRFGLMLALVVSFVLGFFVGFWVVLFRHYFLSSHDKNRNSVLMK
jgi:capsular polysaccharide biosynthesis protein